MDNLVKGLKIEMLPRTTEQSPKLSGQKTLLSWRKLSVVRRCIYQSRRASFDQSETPRSKKSSMGIITWSSPRNTASRSDGFGSFAEPEGLRDN